MIKYQMTRDLVSSFMHSLLERREGLGARLRSMLLLEGRQRHELSCGSYFAGDSVVPLA